MSPFVRHAAALAAFILTTACAERSSPVEPKAPDIPDRAATTATAAGSDEQARNERLARRLAIALGNSAFREVVFTALQQSRVREGKVHFQRFLGEEQGRRLQQLAELARENEATIAGDLEGASPLEIYLPVPAHRRAWQGDENVLVATALDDQDVPVAFDSRGRRQLLDPDQPPDIPVIALGRAETSFEPLAGPATVEVDTGGTGGGTPSASSSPGLYMTYARIPSSFEGWLKGAPEFELHILGQDGNSGTMKSYQCAGESAGIPYQYNHDDTEWRGNVMLFSQAQLDGYKAQHPGQALRILVMEDDDTRCVIKTDSARVARFFAQIATSYGQLTGGRDTLISLKTFRKAQTLINIFKALWSAIQSQDDLVGTALEDSVAREYFSGANWIIKGENTVTQGALKLEMR
ncbi:MAG TPA: hypothetical protein VGQ69_14405 [Gemmatimonadales bacterium]|jgi:hypothetical protein|nr:hypothetical protein [Gemmatimonadales bacterium]